VPIDVSIREGDAVREILEQADAMQADLLVVGTHGRTGFERLVLGSVAEKVLRKAVCPVLSVPPRSDEARPIFKRILCPVDFSECSMRALEYAVSMAKEADAHLTVLHVMRYDLDEAPEMYETVMSDRSLGVAEFRARCEASARQRLDDAIPDDARAYCSVDSMTSSGQPYRAILRVAAELQSDLIVMGVRGRGRADLAFLGSATQHVLRSAACPVLTLRTTRS
jgi:nucleotide-binding universal stress UspA family protein